MRGSVVFDRSGVVVVLLLSVEESVDLLLLERVRRFVLESVVPVPLLLGSVLVPIEPEDPVVPVSLVRLRVEPGLASSMLEDPEVPELPPVPVDVSRSRLRDGVVPVDDPPIPVSLDPEVVRP